MRLLDIIVTHYKEDWSVGKKLFDMIGLQRCVDFSQIRVTIVNDGGNMILPKHLNAYPYKIEQVNIEHGGVSAARNAGIEHAEAKWVMFCDFDDNFANIYSLRQILNVLDTDEMDMLWCRILAEDYLDGKQLLYWVPEKQRFVFCHGKLYRRQFLIDSGIRFDTELVFNEDSCFNAVIIANTPYQRIGELKSPFPLYVWVRRENSVTNSGRIDEAAYGHFRRNMKVTEQYPVEDDRYDGMVTRTVYDTYYMVHGMRNSPQMKRRIQDEFAEWIAESDRTSHFGTVTEATMDEIRSVAKSELLELGENIPDGPERVGRWVHDIARMYKEAG